MNENKQLICSAICNALRTTNAAGSPDNNPLVEIQYIQLDNGDEIARPIFADGSGQNEYYDVNISGDSGIGIWLDITEQFVRRMW